MKQFRTLSLKRESLVELTSEDLVAVAGGQQAITYRTCTLGDSIIVCSAHCQWTFNTCEC